MKSNRRRFLQRFGMGAAGLSLGAATPLASLASSSNDKKEPAADDQFFQIGDDIAVANTSYGKVKGFILRGIYQFRGIPYGADTGGKNRFMPPQKPAPWTDVKPAVWWGNSAPQSMDNRYANAYASLIDHWNYDDVSEDCLKLNVWTPATADGKRRPVMVWLHGGGFTAGNGIEQDGYSGENLSRKGNIVFVSINHRLGAFGFSDLSKVGSEKYAYSGNVGALDMIAALEWIKENITQFGGDPDNVTIMGQSGGGAKVCVVAAMPKSKGLIHKGVALSGSSTSAADQSQSQKLGEYILKEAGLSASEIDKLQEMPWKDYLALTDRAVQKFAKEGGRARFAPIADGVLIPKGKFFADANGLSSNVPMIISSMFHEGSISRTNPELEKITAEQAIARLKEGAGMRGGGLGDKAATVYNAYAKAFPDAKPVEVLSFIGANRRAVVETATAKQVQKAPVYVAWFGWNPPLFNNRMRAFHCLDICFWYNNTDVMYTHTGGGARPRKLSDKMSGALLQFMKTGNPNGGGLPTWPVFTVEKGETMILDDQPVVKNDPDGEARKVLLA